MITRKNMAYPNGEESRIQHESSLYKHPRQVNALHKQEPTINPRVLLVRVLSNYHKHEKELGSIFKSLQTMA
jgi:hypothetical protein